jgi:hypothetical protein
MANSSRANSVPPCRAQWAQCPDLEVIWSGQLERQGACQGLSGYSTKLADPAAALEDAEALGGIGNCSGSHRGPALTVHAREAAGWKFSDAESTGGR